MRVLNTIHKEKKMNQIIFFLEVPHVALEVTQNEFSQPTSRKLYANKIPNCKLKFEYSNEEANSFVSKAEIYHT